MAYVIGGWSGQSGLNDCEVYDPKKPEKKWTQIARLNMGMFYYWSHEGDSFFIMINLEMP